MTSHSPQRMAVVKKEEKEPKLIAFLKAAIEATPPGSELCLVTQGSDTPAARAVAGLAASFATNGIAFRVVFARPEFARADAHTAFADIVPCACRVLADPRCHDAHELLLLGPHIAWIGDSMRRNPSQTDSYELHIAGPGSDTALIKMSFERLWKIATPVPGRRDAEAAAVALAGKLAALSGETSGTLALTRH